MEQFKIEITDTFNGDANYCWVRRYTIRAKSLKSALTKAKMHFYGVCPRHKASDYGDSLRADIVGDCVVFFIDYTDSYDDVTQYEAI